MFNMALFGSYYRVILFGKYAIRIKRLFKLRKILCFFGRHDYRLETIALLDMFWLQGGESCLCCGKRSISFDEAQQLIIYAYIRGNEFRQFDKSRLMADTFTHGSSGKKMLRGTKRIL